MLGFGSNLGLHPLSSREGSGLHPLCSREGSGLLGMIRGLGFIAGFSLRGSGVVAVSVISSEISKGSWGFSGTNR